MFMIFQIPNYCPQCNTIYPSGIALGSDSQMGIEDCVSVCPRGHDCSIPDGTFSVRDGLVEISTKAGSEPVLDRIRRLASDAIKGKSDPDEAIKAIEALAPSLSPVIKLVGKNNALLALALLLWFVVEMTKAFTAGGATKPIHIENRPTIENKITIEQRISKNAELGPSDSSVSRKDDKNSKRKKRRLRGQARAAHHHQ